MLYKYLFLLLLLVGCGSVKKSSEEKTIKDNSTKEIDLTKFSSSYTLEPVDLEKPIIVGKDTVYNTRVIYNNTKEIVKEKQANNIESKEEKQLKQVDYSETIKVIANRLIVALIVFFGLSVLIKKIGF